MFVRFAARRGAALFSPRATSFVARASSSCAPCPASSASSASIHPARAPSSSSATATSSLLSVSSGLVPHAQSRFFSSVAEGAEEEELDGEEEGVEEVVSVGEGDGDGEGIEIVVKKRNLKGSYKKFNLLTRLIAGRPVLDALAQVAWEKKRKALAVRSLLNFGAVRAAQEHDIPLSRLYVRKAVVNKGPMLKRIRFHARGRVGKNFHRHSHLVLHLQEMKKSDGARGAGVGKRRKKKWKNPQHWYQRPDKEVMLRAKEKKQERRRRNAEQNAQSLGAQIAA